MRKVSEKCRRALSAILAAAMVLTSAPGTAMPVLAAEQTAVVTEVSDADEMTADEAAAEDDADKDAADDADKSSADDADKSDADAADKSGAADKDAAEKEAADEGDPAGEVTVTAPTIAMSINNMGVESGARVSNSAAVTVTFTADEGATIKYTTDGGDPIENGTEGASTTVSTSNILGETVTIKAVAVLNEQTSEVSTATVVFEAKPQLSAPSFTKTPADGNSANRTNASFTLTSEQMEQSNAADQFTVKYYISDTELESESVVSTIKQSGTEYTAETESVTVTAPDQNEAAVRYVYAMAIPTEQYEAEWLESECASTNL